MRHVSGFLVGCTILAAAPLAAQENRAWPERTFVTIDVPFQPLNNAFSESLSFADTVRKTENVTFGAGYASTRGALFDTGAGVRLANNLGVGVTASWFQRSRSGSFDLMVPNPLVANKPLDLAGSVSGLNRAELGIHIQALYALALGKRARVMLEGGPSIFNTKQDLVRSIEFRHVARIHVAQVRPGAHHGGQEDRARVQRGRRHHVGAHLALRDRHRHAVLARKGDARPRRRVRRKSRHRDARGRPANRRRDSVAVLMP
jgi:hypothetical protein